MKRQQVGILVIAAIVVIGGFVALVAHNGKKTTNDKQSSATSQAATATNTVTIKNYMFGPMAIKVKAGTTVTWTNQDEVNHTVTADNPSSDAPSSMDIAQGKSFSFKFTKAGTYTYHCFPHPYMHGTVIVE